MEPNEPPLDPPLIGLTGSTIQSEQAPRPPIHTIHNTVQAARSLGTRLVLPSPHLFPPSQKKRKL